MKKLYVALFCFGILQILGAQTISPILLPKFIGAGTAGSRLQTACRLKISGLVPNTLYKYYTGISNSAAASPGVLKGGTYFIQTPATGGLDIQGYSDKLSTSGTVIGMKEFNTAATPRYGTFFSSPTGDYTGWFSVVADNSFTGGALVYFYVVINNGSDVAIKVPKQLEVRDFASTFNGMGQPVGALPIIGTTFNTTEQMVVLWDNDIASGDPVSITWTENDGVGVPATFNSWYTSATGVEGKPGKWAALLPATNGNGIHRIDYYDGNGLLNYSHIDINNDGDWCSVATDWQTGGTTPVNVSGITVEKLTIERPIKLDMGLSISTGNPVGSLTLNADLTVNPYTLVLNQTNIAGTGKILTDATSNLEYQGASSLGTNVTIPAYITELNNLKINNPAGVYLGGNLTVWNQLDLSNAPGRLYLNDKTFTLNGPPIIPAAAGIASTANSSLIFGGTATGIFIPSECWQLKNLTVTNPNGLTLKSNTTVYNSVNFSNGAVIQTQSYDLFVQGDIIGNGQQINTTPTGRVLMSNSNNYIQKVQGSFASLEINSGAIFTGDVITTQKFNSSGSNVQIGPNKLTIGGTWEGDASKVIGTPQSTIEFAGTIPQVFPITAVNVLNIGTLIINNPTTVDLSAEITLSTALVLQQGNFRDQGKIVNLKGDIRGTATHSGTGKIIMAGKASKAYISDATIGNLDLNSAQNFELNGIVTGETKIAGQLNLISGRLDVVNKGLYFIGNTSVPIVRTNGAINTSKQSSLGFGMKTSKQTGTNFSIPVGTFTLSSTSPTRSTGGVELGTFIVNRTNPLTLQSSEPFDIHKLLSIVQGELILSPNYQMDLKSNSITETAMVDVIADPTTAKITYGTNSRFSVERHIPKDIDGGAGRRAYRDLAIGVVNTVGSMWDNWQEGAPATPIAGVGMHISGKVGPLGVNDPATGLDMTTTGNPSAFIGLINNSSGNSTLTPITNTKTIEFNGLLPYHAFIRGDRYYTDWDNMQYMTTTVKLRAKGKLIVGDVVITKNNASAPSVGFSTNTMKMNFGLSNGTTMIANPYAAPISWSKLLTHNSTVTNTYTVWDPNVNTLGGYVSYNSLLGCINPGSAVTDVIQPGQSFYVRNANTTNSSFTFKETDKFISQTALTTVFKSSAKNQSLKEAGPVQKIGITLARPINGVNTTVDGAIVAFDKQFSNDIDYNDAPKGINPENNVSVLRNGKEFSIETRNAFNPNDTIPLQISKLTADTVYQLSVDANALDLPPETEIFIADRSANSLLPVAKNQKTSVFFQPVSDGSDKNRFSLIFRTAAVLPLNFINFTGYPTEKGAQLQWFVSEKDIVKYSIQKSSDAITFKSISEFSSKGNGENAYAYCDETFNADSYYRIMGLDKSNNNIFTQIIKVSSIGKITAEVYPNPANDILSLRAATLFSNGTAVIRIFNSIGQIVTASNATVKNNSINHQVNISNLTPGKYTAQVVTEKDNFSLQFDKIK